MLRNTLGGILIYSFVIYAVIEFGPQFDLHAIAIDPPNSLRITPLFLLIGGIFRLVYNVVRRVLKLLTLPFNWITFGLAHLAVNVSMLYLFAELVNQLDKGVTINMGSFLEVMILAGVLSIVSLFIKYL